MFDRSDAPVRRRSPAEILRQSLPLDEAERHDGMAAELLAWWRGLQHPRVYPGWRSTVLVRGRDRLLLVALVRRRPASSPVLVLDREALAGNADIPVQTRRDALALFQDDCAEAILSGRPAYHRIGLPGGPPVCRRVILPFAAGSETAERLMVGLEPGPAARGPDRDRPREHRVWLS